MTCSPYYLDAVRRRLTKEAILGACATKGWEALALHVRKTHVHAVIAADADPDTVMTRLNADASRLINATDPSEEKRRRWTTGGSRRFLWNEEQVRAAMLYVLLEQGEPMEIFCPQLDEVVRLPRGD